MWGFKGKRLLRIYDYEVYINRGYFGDMIMEYIGMLGYQIKNYFEDAL